MLRMSKLQSHKPFQQVSRITSMGFGSKSMTVLTMCQQLSSKKPAAVAGGGQGKMVAVKAAGCDSVCVVVSEPKTDRRVNLRLLLRYVVDITSRWMKFVTKDRPWKWNIQMYVEKVIVDCRFFILLAVAGSLMSGVLCFIEGCVLVLESYFQYFNALQRISDQGQVILRLIEAIDMFLVGTAMVIFGVALHVMFVGQNNLKPKRSQHYDSPVSVSTSSTNFSLEKLPAWIGMETAIDAKSKIGHAIIMILQVQLLEKFKTIPVTSGLDLACFAGAVFYLPLLYSFSLEFIYKKILVHTIQ